MATSAANGGDSASATSSPLRRPNLVTFSSNITEHSEKSPSLVSLLGLTAYQQQQLTQTWPRIQRSGGYSSGSEIFRKVTMKYAPVKETFQKANICGRFSKAPGYDIYKEHGKLLFDVLQMAMKSLQDTSADDLIDLCAQYGSKHAPLKGGEAGFQMRMWDDFSEILVEHVTRSEGVRGRREAIKAWTQLIVFIVGRMKDGYDSGLRKPQIAKESSVTMVQQQTVNDGPSTDEHNSSKSTSSATGEARLDSTG